MRTRNRVLLFVLILGGAAVAADGPRKLKPGFNLFSKEQDIQLGKEAAGEVEKQYTVIGDGQLNAYLQRIGSKLAATQEAGGYPYTFKLVNDKSINAFALPGGPAFVNTGLLAAAENEAQVAGVIAHEIAHVALRHGTNQVSKAQLLQLPAALAAAAAGQRGGMLGSLAQLGVGLGAGSVLLKFSRNAERDADLLGTRIMAKAGYNPIEMARFFEKLEAQGGSRGPQFLSDHPNPGNRVKSVEAEIRYLPKGKYSLGDAQQFAQMQRAVAGLPPAPERTAQQKAQGQAPPVPRVRPSTRMREHRTSAYSLLYPEDWQIREDQQSGGASMTPQEGIVGNAVGAGVIVNLSQPAGSGDLRQNTETLLKGLVSANAGMKVKGQTESRVDGQSALATTLESPSPYAGETEVDTLITVQRPQGLFYVVLIAPQSAAGDLRDAFNSVLRSIQFEQ
jgi:hypothetical protein